MKRNKKYFSTFPKCYLFIALFTPAKGWVIFQLQCLEFDSYSSGTYDSKEYISKTQFPAFKLIFLTSYVKFTSIRQNTDNLFEPFKEKVDVSPFNSNWLIKYGFISRIEKKGKDKRFNKNWWPISLLNINYKIASKALAERLKKIFPVFISHEQTA